MNGIFDNGTRYTEFGQCAKVGAIEHDVAARAAGYRDLTTQGQRSGGDANTVVPKAVFPYRLILLNKKALCGSDQDFAMLEARDIY